MIFRYTSALFLFLASTAALVAQNVDLPEVRSSRQTEGLYENQPQLVAITGANVVRFPGDEPNVETVLIRNDRIENIGAGLAIPAGARTIDAAGRFLYAGLIDAYHSVEVPFDTDTGTSYWNDQVRSQIRFAEKFKLEDLKTESKRKLGITATLCVPKDGVIKGTSALILMLDDEANPEHAVLAADVAQHFRLTVARGRDDYPNSPMGAVALARQALYDTQWYSQTLGTDSQSETNRSLHSLSLMLLSKQTAIFETSNELFNLRADRFAREFKLPAVTILGNGHEYRRIDAIAKTGRPHILPVNFPKPPEVGTPELADDVSLESLMHWEHAPKNPAALAKANIPFCFTSHGLKEQDNFLDKVRTAVKHGLSQTDALAALTTSSAKLLGQEKAIGKVERGLLANLVITDKPIFDDKAKILQTWVAGQSFEIGDADDATVVWEIKTPNENFSGSRVQVGKSIELYRDKENSTKLKHATHSESSLAGSFSTKTFGGKGWAQLSATFTSDDTATGSITMPDGQSLALQLTRSDAAAFETKQDKDRADKKAPADKDIAAISRVNFPFGYAGVEAPPADPGSVLIRNAMIWTCARDGNIERGSVLFADGKIKAIFAADVPLPAADNVIDAGGAHLTPGIIDCHSHMASDSGINESGQAITAEVRIGDMIDPDDITIYRQLAGGVTTSNILHGSANPIGGQNQVIKLRWGGLEDEMKFKGAPQGIKFALGENVKQSNWENPTNRYPQTRMGVDQIFDNAFEEAKLYRAKQAAGDAPVRVNLELEAIAEILEGKRWIHCHSYRQDEILSLIRLLDRHNVRIGTFQHILEGYKVADEMAKHGAMGSAFSDWWAYKYEVKDAIPHAGALMHQRGVVMSFNSDDGELARHLNQEAAKAVRYGGLSHEEALNFVTINPAKQLRIDNRVGSIEIGKDADLVIWSHHPLSNLARAEQTWIDGKKYYDRIEDAAGHQEFTKLKQQLVQKVLRSGEEMETENGETADPARFWPRHDAFCHHKDHEGHDHDEHE